MRTSALSLVLCYVFAASAAGPAAPPAGSAPVIDGSALDGSVVHLPARSGGTATVLVLGFSEKSSGEAAAWARRLKTADWLHRDADFYEIPMLAGLPRLLRPVVLHEIRKQIPAAVQGRVVPLFSGERDWRSAAQVTTEDDVYLLVLDKDWNVRWRGKGSCSDELFRQVTAQVEDAQH